MMGHHRCCCGGVEEFACDNPPVCKRVDLSGFVGQSGSNFPQWPASDYVILAGVNGSFTIPWASTALTVPILIRGTVSSGSNAGDQFLAADTMTISVITSCVSNVITLQTIRVSLGYSVPPSSFSSEHFFTSGGIEFGTPISNSLTYSDGLVTDDDGTAIVTLSNECTPNNFKFYAQKCGDPSTRITVDLETLTGFSYNCEYLGDRYELTEERSTDSAVTVTWVAVECPSMAMGATPPAVSRTLPRQRIPADYDVDSSASSPRQRGCCDGVE